MVISAPEAQSQPHYHPSLAEEEALQRNTDCIYFLASPLTCKKGSDCEYRHSDNALINPRDCYFWLQGNCLNPKCGFRHPPLDGLLGRQAPTSTGPSAPVSQAVIAHAPNTSTKPSVPCIFFQKGYCLKGDWCPFLHMPNLPSNKPSPTPPADIKKDLSRPPENHVQQKNNAPANVAKSTNNPAGPKAPSRNESAINRRAATQTTADIDVHRHRNTIPLSNGSPFRIQQSHHLDNLKPDRKDNDEISREPSPGFDVLVDDDLRDSDYYPGDSRFGLTRVHEAQNEYDIELSNDYRVVFDDNEERYQGRPIGHARGQCNYEQSLGEPHIDRHATTNWVDKLDLRHRLAKLKKPNGLRSVISHENARHTDQRNLCLHSEVYQENTIRSRLRGRIGLPQRSPSPNNRRVGTLFPGRDQGSIHDGVRGRTGECFANVGRNYKGPYSRRDIVAEDSINFAGPKSLFELKKRKNMEMDRKSLGKRKQQESKTDLLFEGPMPLEEILKRKRGVSNNGQGLQQEGEILLDGRDMASKSEVRKSDTFAQKGEARYEKVDVSKAEENDALHEEFEEEEGQGDYEQVGVEDYGLYEGDNVDYADDDDDDDFAKKMGVVYS